MRFQAILDDGVSCVEARHDTAAKAGNASTHGCLLFQTTLEIAQTLGFAEDELFPIPYSRADTGSVYEYHMMAPWDELEAVAAELKVSLNRQAADLGQAIECMCRPFAPRWGPEEDHGC